MQDTDPTLTSHADGGADASDAGRPATALDTARGLAVVFGPAVVLNAAWLVSSRACIRALRSGRRPGPVPLALAASAVAYHGYLRPRMHRWGATEEERIAVLPGDEADADPGEQTTRGLTIDAPVEDVWPWLAQIGQDRAGFYSYQVLENLVGCRMHSADRILAEHQRLAPGDEIRLGPAGYPCFRVQEVRPPSTLVLLSQPPRPGAAEAGVASWQWQLRPCGEAGSRLVVRQRLDYPDRFGLMWRLVEPIGFVMERRMLRGLKQRAEEGRDVRPPR